MPKTRIIATLGLALVVPLWALAQDPAEKPADAPAILNPEVAALMEQ